ncbi:Bug family tripartite tricarboxylate transporter substrate binding protein [Roseomonas rosulenta]|uniref:Bug family tripartite tricarboxylate transporter substrate binding protein n=1 Tax=Roseomonas rosulenta TaxID=2748667 RepID=UPI0018DFE969|nr:tripartite tricarboxylate transporter substrate-binding protein [Roseomonas rosulenta]
MKPNRRSTLALALAGLAAPTLVKAQGAAGWRPTRPVRLIVAAAPGGSNDIVARIIAEPVAQLLGQPVVIDNRAGAGSIIGSEAAARSPADGHVLLINSSLPTLPAMVSRMPYDTLADFEGVAVAGFSPHLLVVNPRVEARTAEEFVALLRASPGRFNYASAGIGSGPHIGGLLFMSRMNVTAETVHYRGGGPGVAAMASGEAHFGTPTMASALGQVRGGALRALAVLSEQRSPALPEVPSATEAGLPGVVHEEFFPIVAPRGTPPEAVAALGAAFRQAIQQSAPRLNELAGVAPRPGFDTNALVMAQVREAMETHTRILRAAGVQPE